MGVVFTEGLNLGDLLKYEAPNLYSRDRVTVRAGQVLALGAVVGRVASTDEITAFDPAATDGSAVVAGVLLQPVDATRSRDRNGVLLARHAIVADHALTWPATLTAPEIAAAIRQLHSLGILVRKAA